MTSDKSYSTENRLNALLNQLGGNGASQPSIQFAGAGSILNPLTSTSMGSFTIPANDPPGPGAEYRFLLFGHAGFGTAGNQITFHAYRGNAGGSLMYSSSGFTCDTAGATARIWSMTGSVMVAATGSSGQLYAHITMHENIQPPGSAGAAWQHPGIGDGIAVDTTVSWTIQPTVYFSASSGAQNASVLNGVLRRLF